MAHTALFDVHKELQAKMVPQNSWDMPLFYPGGTLAEHRHTLKEASLFDTGNRSCFQITGADLKAKLSGLFLRDCQKIAAGEFQENFLLSDDGNIALKLLLVPMAEDDFFAILDQGISGSEKQFFIEKISSVLECRELSDFFSSFVLAGKRSGIYFNDITGTDIPEGCFDKVELAVEDEKFRSIVLHGKYSGLNAYEFFFNQELAPELYEVFYRNSGIEPAGIAAAESLRIENMVPGAAEFASSIKPESCPDICKDAFRESSATSPLLVTVDLGRNPAPNNSDVLDKNGNVVGKVCSGAFCPGINCARVWCRINDRNLLDKENGLFFKINGETVNGKII